MPKTKVTPRAKHPNKTKQFLDATQIALEMFDDEISSFTDEVKEKAYKQLCQIVQRSTRTSLELSPICEHRHSTKDGNRQKNASNKNHGRTFKNNSTSSKGYFGQN